MAIKQYYGSKISNNMTKLDNGCLICFNVPIARTGTQVYRGDEVGMNSQEVVSVHREESEVFSAKTIASFNGCAFTSMHPAEDVTVDNWQMHSKGEVSDVRKGSGEYSNCLVADIIVRDPVTINEIESGARREVSAGYYCEYVTRDGKVYQEKIRGNHVALVHAGRAGSLVRINDSAPTKAKWKANISKAIRAMIK